MLLKFGVDISRLKPEIRRSLKTVESIFWTLSEREAIITSTFEGSHKVASLHYANQAIDVRIPETKRQEIFQAITNALRKDFDVINEVDHIHIEYDPK